MEKNFDVNFEGFPYPDKIYLKSKKLERVSGDSILVAELDLDSLEIRNIFNNIRKNDLFSLPDFYKPEPECDGFPIRELN
ncbi:hypothetical protein [Arundinibacter roseus]|uniref:Uncharacterized protein n=1 Tax=Arundinibacter roseus TaxID=2070510 RepID=A0A4R4K099_9BACT|nr:hypothetical protein [Arundinibacter roseus]TDB59856.1 hypothetical protein EZE20_22150 [Arundinibacter roseus]